MFKNNETQGASKFATTNVKMSAAMLFFCGLGHLSLASIVVSKSAGASGLQHAVIPSIDFIIASVAIILGIACLIGVVKRMIFPSALLGVTSLIFFLVYLCYTILIFNQDWYYFGMKPTSAGICALTGTLLMIYVFISNIVYLLSADNRAAIEKFLA